MDTTKSVGPIDRPDVEVYSPGKGWEPATSWVFLTSKGLASAKANGWAVHYTFRWRRDPTGARKARMQQRANELDAQADRTANWEDAETLRTEAHIARNATTTGDKLTDLRRIVDTRTMGHVIHDDDLIPMDLTSAHAIVTVYDALNEQNQAHYLTLHPLTMATIAFKLAT